MSAVGKFFKVWAKQAYRGSTQALRGLREIIPKLPSALDDIGSIIANPDLDNILDNLVDVVQDLDIIETQWKLTKSDFKAFTADIKAAIEEIKAEKRKQENNKNTNSEQNRKDINKNMRQSNNKQKKNSDANNPNKSHGSKSSNRNKFGATNNTGKNHPEWYLKGYSGQADLIGINIGVRQNTLLPYVNRLSVEGTNVNPGLQSNGSVPSTAGIILDLVIPQTESDDWAQGINYLYQNLRSANAGAINYDPGIVSRYVHAVRCLDAVLSYLGRAISIVNQGTFYDAKAPQVYFAAMGLDYDTFSANIANARELYDRYRYILMRVAPLNITLRDRTRWLFSHTFKDSNDIKSQNYLFGLERVYTSDSDGAISVVRIGKYDITESATGNTYEGLITAIQALFDNFQSDDTFQIVAGDIIKAYKEESIIDIGEFERNITVCDEHVLTQIQNATLSLQGGIDPRFSLDTAGYLRTSPIESISASVLDSNATAAPSQIEILGYELENPVYNANQDVVDKGRLLSSTRLMASRAATNAPTNNDTATVNYTTYGSELVDKIVVVYYSNSSRRFGLSNIVITYLLQAITLTNSGSVQLASDMPVWTWFDYFPLTRQVYMLFNNSNSPIWIYNFPNLDFNNFGTAYKQNLATYHAIATLSMLFTPYLFKSVKTEVIKDL